MPLEPLFKSSQNGADNQSAVVGIERLERIIDDRMARIERLLWLLVVLAGLGSSSSAVQTVAQSIASPQPAPPIVIQTPATQEKK